VSELPGALITAAMAGRLAPMVSTVYAVTVDADGPLSVDVGFRPGFVRVILNANCTGFDLLGQPGLGQMQLFILEVEQGATGGFTWTPPINVAWSGGAPAMAATMPGHKDVYTLTWDGEVWVESGRMLDVYLGG
jgi:hypothetical protein